MTLDKTVELMLSDDYKDRFEAEYRQVVHRANKLRKMIRKYERGELDFEPDCPIDLLVWQLKVMDEYIYVLKRRSGYECIKL